MTTTRATDAKIATEVIRESKLWRMERVCEKERDDYKRKDPPHPQMDIRKLQFILPKVVHYCEQQDSFARTKFKSPVPTVPLSTSCNPASSSTAIRSLKLTCPWRR